MTILSIPTNKAGGLYRVAFRFDGLPSLPPRTKRISSAFSYLPELASAVQFVSEYKEDHFGTPVPEGIRLVFEVLADSSDEAAEVADHIADEVCRVAAFQAGAPYVRPHIVALLDVTPGRPRRFYQQWCYRPELGTPTREVDVSEIETTAYSLGRRSEDERDAIMLSVKWYTDALTEHDLLDRFLKAWVGLESIGQIINRRAHSGGWRECTKCIGSIEARDNDDRQERGMRHVFSAVEPEHPDLFDRLKKARNKLVHAEWPLRRVRTQVEPYAVLTTKVLTRALLTAIAPAGRAASREAFEPALPIDPSVFSISLELLTCDPNALGELCEKLQVRISLTSSNMAEGRYRAKAKFDIRAEFPCDFENIELRPEYGSGGAVELEVDDAPELLEVYAVQPDGSAQQIR